ncbi:response regulator, partial [Legionella sp.]|uniref:response regulator n=1 Tax=Legionella sp. TaxID=459 RepID=UPI003CB6171B
LIIEDNEICQQIYKFTFNQLKCPFTLAGTAKEALCLVNQHRYHCILTDWGLPDCDDESLVKAMRTTSLNKATPIFVISAQVSPYIIRVCQELKLQGVYSKPLTLTEIKALVTPYL